MASYKVFDDDAPLAVDRVFEADDDHSVAIETAAPAFGSILSIDPSTFDEPEIAGGTDVVVAVVALRAVEASGRWRDRVGADIAFCAKCEGNMRIVELIFRRLRLGGLDGGEGGRRDMLCRIRWSGVEGISRQRMRSREEWMCAAFALIHASIAVAPFTIITDLALPKALRCKGRTIGTERARLKTFARV